MSQKTTFFLIDDDIDDQEIFSYVMRAISGNVQIEFAYDGVDALEQIKGGSFTPDVIFLDINMPRMDGIECLAELKKIDRLGPVPIYIYSTSAEMGIPEKCKKLGAAGFIKKHINTDDVKKEFETIIANLRLAVT